MNHKKNIIWQMHRLMLPEVTDTIHRKKEKQQLVEKPLLAEERLEELERNLRASLDSARPARFTYYRAGVIKSIVGVPIKVKGSYLVILDQLNELYIPLKDLLDIS